jgi:hypothetical protein
MIPRNQSRGLRHPEAEFCIAEIRKLLKLGRRHVSTRAHGIEVETTIRPGNIGV